MSVQQDKKKKQVKLARLEIVSKLYKRGYSFRAIQKEVMSRLSLNSYSTYTVKKDIESLLKEWREERIGDLDDVLQVELARIDDTVRELWEQWEKSKEDYSETSQTRKGSPTQNKDTGESHIKTYSVESREKNILGLGDPRYIAEIRMQLAERRKLLGVYAPEKKEVSGNISFASLLVESGMLDEAENSINQNNNAG